VSKNKQPSRAFDSSKKSSAFQKDKKEATEYFSHHPVWQFKLVDMDHKDWGWKNLNIHMIDEILQKLTDYESRTWHEIRSDKKRDHYVPIDNITREAQKRLQELKIDDTDALYRLRLSGSQRVWGILDGFIFKIIWWDEDHSVCLSNRR